MNGFRALCDKVYVFEIDLSVKNKYGALVGDLNSCDHFGSKEIEMERLREGQRGLRIQVTDCPRDWPKEILQGSCMHHTNPKKRNGN